MTGRPEEEPRGDRGRPCCDGRTAGGGGREIGGTTGPEPGRGETERAAVTCGLGRGLGGGGRTAAALAARSRLLGDADR